MEYKELVEARFLKRENRFIALVEVEGKEERIHVPNTGRCRELFVEGAKVLVSKAAKGSLRKTNYSLIHVEKEGRWINIDSQSPNRLVAEYLEMTPSIGNFGPVISYQREVKQGNSRLDFQISSPEKEGFIEVKGVTLERRGHAFFPDAPTSRGRKHVEELSRLSRQGIPTFVFFVIQMKGVHTFTPNWEMDPLFSEALLRAHKEGVGIYAIDTTITREKMTLDRYIPIHWEREIKIEKAQSKDMDQIEEIYLDASRSLKEEGVNQWQGQRPNKTTLLADIQSSHSYVHCRDKKVLATGALIEGEEPTYKNIFHGQWPNQDPYTTLHRFAIREEAKKQGLGKQFLQALIDQSFALGYKNVRIDTHKDNKKMLALIKSMGFSYCGLIYVNDGSQRLAFIKELS